MKIKTLLFILISLILVNCAKDDDSKEISYSSENKILSFKIPGNGLEFTGTIDETNKSIRVSVSDLDLSNPITPIIEISDKARISPSASTAQRFDEEVEYTVTAENGEKAVYKVLIYSSNNQIISFGIKPDATTFYGVIDEREKTITIETTGLEVNSTLIPTIEYSPNASISPDPSIAQDFSEYVTYTVTAQNGDQATYTVITENTPLTNEKKILSFEFKFGSKIYEGIIDHNNLTVDIEVDRFAYNIVPLITISEGAHISPNPNEPQNFYRDVSYTVTAADNTSNIYTVKTKAYEMKTVIPSKFYSNGVGLLEGNGIDLRVPNSFLIIENSTESYTLNSIESYYTEQPFGNLGTRHSFSFPEDVSTATYYKFKYVVDGETKVTSTFTIDILAADLPVITSSNQSTYHFRDTMVLYGENLVPGVLIYAVNGSAYRFDSNNITVNEAKTEMTIHLNNQRMFPSFYGRDEPFSTQITIDYQTRRGSSFTVDFK